MNPKLFIKREKDMIKRQNVCFIYNQIKYLFVYFHPTSVHFLYHICTVRIRLIFF